MGHSRHIETKRETQKVFDVAVAIIAAVIADVDVDGDADFLFVVYHIICVFERGVSKFVMDSESLHPLEVTHQNKSIPCSHLFLNPFSLLIKLLLSFSMYLLGKE